MATACFRDLTGLPEPPDFREPVLNLCITASQGMLISRRVIGAFYEAFEVFVNLTYAGEFVMKVD